MTVEASAAATRPHERARDVPLGTLIFREGLLGADEIEDALREGMKSGERLGEVLMRRGLLDERDLARLLAAQKGFDFTELDASERDPDVVSELSKETALRYHALPLRREGGGLVVAIPDPTNEIAMRALESEVGADVRFTIAPRSELRLALARAHGNSETGVTRQADDSALAEAAADRPPAPDPASASVEAAALAPPPAHSTEIPSSTSVPGTAAPAPVEAPREPEQASQAEPVREPDELGTNAEFAAATPTEVAPALPGAYSAGAAPESRADPTSPIDESVPVPENESPTPAETAFLADAASVGEHRDAPAAPQVLRERGRPEWLLVNGRFVAPWAIASIDVLDEGDARARAS